ncbi:MAG TPA: TlpA disulfide reductase family protein [Acidimicrobiia bacterium]
MRAVCPLIAVLALLVAACGGDPVGSSEAPSSVPVTAASTTVTAPTATTMAEMAGPVGSVAPFVDARVFTEELAEKDLPVVVHFWKPDCVECVAEAKVMADAARRYEGRVEFIGIDTADDQPSAKAFVAEAGIPYATYFDFFGLVGNLAIEPSEVSGHHSGVSVPKVPVSLLFGPGGTLVEVNHQAWEGDAFGEAIDGLLRLEPGEGVARIPEFDLSAFQEEMAGSDLPTVVWLFDGYGDSTSEIQAVTEITGEYDGRMNFVGINTWDYQLEAQMFLLDHQVSFPQLLDSKGWFCWAYGGAGMWGPLFLFAPGGELAETHERVAAWGTATAPDTWREVLDQFLASVG